MRWLRGLSLAILLLTTLTSQSNAAEQSSAGPIGKPNQTTQTQKPSSEAGPQTSQKPTPTIKPAAQHAADIRNAYTYSYYYHPENGGNWSAFVQAAATFGLLIFAAWQSGLIRRTTKATEKAAIASKDAAEATQRYVEITGEMISAAKKSADAATA